MINIYADNNYKRWLTHRCNRQYFINVNIQRINKGIIVNEHIHGFGVFDKFYKFIKKSSQVRGHNGQFIPKFNHKQIRYINEDVVFVGNVYPQFGHFLLEHMNRAWALLDKPYAHKKIVLINNQDVNPIPQYMYTFFELLGVKYDDIIILNHTAQFKNVYVPDQAFNLPIFTSKKFADTFIKIANNIKSKYKFEKIYVSRTALKTRKTFGEEKIQKIFEQNGFKIIYPETLSLIEQIALVKNCKVLAGCAGTALHLALFMKSGGTVIQIKRNKIKKDNADTQCLINKIKGLNSVFISGSIESTKTDHGSFAPQIIGLNRYMKEFFDKNGFRYNDDDLKFDYEAWCEYQNVLYEYKKQYGNSSIIWLKRQLVRYSACIIPGRENRGFWRRWLSRKLNLT